MASVKYARDMPEGFTNRIERLAIIGSGGNMGSRIVSELKNSGSQTITAITRPGSTSVIPPGLRAIPVDYTSDDPSALAAALRGQQFLLVALSIDAPRDTILKIIRAAILAEVPYILPNWYGHDPNNDTLITDSLLNGFRDGVRAAFAGQHTSSYLLLACGFWYEFSLGGGAERFGLDVSNKSMTWFDDGTVQQNVTTWAQCAKAVARLANLKLLPADEKDDLSTTLSGLRNSAIYVKSFTLSQEDMFESVKRVTGTGDKDWTFKREAARQRWEKAGEEVKGGQAGSFVKMLYSRMFVPPGDGVHDAKHNVLLGLEEEVLDEHTKVAVKMGEREDWASYVHK